MKKVLLCHEDAIIGGASNFIYAIAQYLSNNGYQVVIIEGKTKLKNKTQEVKNKVKVYRYKVNDDNFLERHISIIKQTKKIAEKLHSKYNFNLIHLHLTTPSLGILLSTKLKNIPKIYHFYGAWDLESLSKKTLDEQKSKIVKIKIFLKYQIQKYVINKSKKIIAISKYAKKILINHFKINPKKIVVIGGGFDSKNFYPTKIKKSFLKKRLGLLKNSKMIFAASRLEPRKGLVNLIKALKYIIPTHKNLKLFIAFPRNKGWEYFLAGIMAAVFDNNMQKYINFVTNPSKKILRKLYQTADCFIMSSENLETFGLTTVEALACGTPVLGTPTGATPEILKALNKKFLFSDSSPKSMAKKINWFFSLKESKLNSLRHEINDFSKKYKWSNSLKKLLTVYSEIIEIN